MKNEPLRMCLSCRQVKPKNELIKFVKLSNNQVEVDLLHKKAGRGAYICFDSACHIKLHKHKLLNKAFSTFVDDSVYKELENVYNKLKQNV
ncbi:MAG: DUF448 domain-containing protein [Tenericutes bacterium HGW-Tenericutes-4]|jgi:hypothetical protein|nr:MAG: DUF448 domain-containing protein [Tenericutes bacterium HGW-Tenericutes-4]